MKGSCVLETTRACCASISGGAHPRLPLRAAFLVPVSLGFSATASVDWLVVIDFVASELGTQGQSMSDSKSSRLVRGSL